MQKKQHKPKIIVILGPTSSGKSDLAVNIAKKFNGEVISADSRQVYTGLNLGTGKITKKEMRGIPHHLLDVANPKKRFTINQYKKLADKAVTDIVSRNKLPIICGGTGFYIQAVVENIILPDVSPNLKLRKELEKKSAVQLFAILKKLDPKRAKEIDPMNARRIIRAIEIVKSIGQVPKIVSKPQYESLSIGIETEAEVLKERIYNRILKRIKKGMVSEAKNLHAEGLSYKRMQELGLEYKLLAQLLQKNISKEEFIEQLKNETWHYVKRQITWFKRDKNIIWLNLNQLREIEKTVKKFIEKKK